MRSPGRSVLQGGEWYYVKLYQRTWWKYVAKNKDDEPIREREGRRIFWGR